MLTLIRLTITTWIIDCSVIFLCWYVFQHYYRKYKNYPPGKCTKIKLKNIHLKSFPKKSLNFQDLYHGHLLETSFKWTTSICIYPLCNGQWNTVQNSCQSSQDYKMLWSLTIHTERESCLGILTLVVVHNVILRSC